MKTGAYTAAAFLTALLAGAGIASAHHSFSAVYDAATVTEIEGTVTRVLWRNPHVRFTIKGKNEQGREGLWDVETHSVSILRRMQISSDVLKIGDRIRIAGNPGKRGTLQMFAHNALLPNGQEVLLQPGSVARWSKQTLGSSATWLAAAGKASDPARGIFRVWSSSLSASFLFPDDPKTIASYPLTPAARAALARFDPVRDAPTQNCAPKGMPTIMEQPYPMEFVQQGGNIVLRLEEYDTERTIRMSAPASGKSVSPTLLGDSVGRWDGRTLVVTTTGVSWRYLNQAGVPLGPGAEIMERFTPSTDGSRLDYELTVTDPRTFTRPVVLKKNWIWLPEITLSKYECANGR
jgi:hypothetical protein